MPAVRPCCDTLRGFAEGRHLSVVRGLCHQQPSPPLLSRSVAETPPVGRAARAPPTLSGPGVGLRSPPALACGARVEGAPRDDKSVGRCPLLHTPYSRTHLALGAIRGLQARTTRQQPPSTRRPSATNSQALSYSILPTPYPSDLTHPSERRTLSHHKHTTL